jgi:hypothetical protein
MNERTFTGLALLGAAALAVLVASRCERSEAANTTANTTTPATASEPDPPPRGALTPPPDQPRVAVSAGTPDHSGLVVDSRGAPIGGAEVLAVPPQEGLSRRTISGADGSFTLPDDLAPGALRVLAHHADYLVTNIAATAPWSAPLRLQLARRPGLQVVVRRRDGAPLAEFAARVQRGDDEPRPLGVDDTPSRHWPGGSFTATRDEPGLVLVTIAAPGYAPAAVQLETRADAVASAELWLDLGAHVRGTLVDHAGAAVPDATIALRPTTDSAPHAQARTDAAGEFALPSLAAGTYDVTAFHEQLPQLRSLGVNIVAAVEPQPLRLQLPAGARAHGQVRGLRPDQIAEVVFRHVDGPVRRAPLDPFGTYTLERLTPGAHRVAVVYPRDATLRQLAAAVDDLALPNGIVLADTQDLRFDFDDPWQSLGRVLGRARLGDAPEQLRVVARHLDRPLPPRVAGLYTAMPRADGSFTLDAMLPGRWQLEVRLGANTLASDEITVPAGGVLRWER